MKKILAAGSVALLISGGLVLGTASAASAHTPAINVDCDSISMDLFNYPAGDNVFTATLDGQDFGTTVFGTEYHSGTIELDPTVPHSWTVTIDSSDGTEWDTIITGESDPECIPVVEIPEQPADEVTQQISVPVIDCEARTASVTTTTNTTPYVWDGKSWVAGETATTSVTDTRAATEAECPLPVQVTPLACVPVGDWYTEDDDEAPVSTEDGLVFTGGSGSASGIRVAATGNLQGWTSVSYDASGSTDVFYFRLVLDTAVGNGGGWPYTSVTVTSGSPVTLDSTAYVSKLGASFTLAQIANLYPNAVITSAGFHLDSAATSEDVVTLASVTGPCATVDFTYTEEPPVVEPPVVVPPVVTPSGPAPVEPVANVVPTAVEADSLAETGVDATGMLSVAGLGLLILALGAGAIFWRIRLDRREAKHKA
jgi:hypothetical protein